MNHQPLTSQNLLQDTFGDSVRDLRIRGNHIASQSMARFTLLSLAFLIVLLVKAWI